MTLSRRVTAKKLPNLWNNCEIFHGCRTATVVKCQSNNSNDCFPFHYSHLFKHIKCLLRCQLCTNHHVSESTYEIFFANVSLLNCCCGVLANYQSYNYYLRYISLYCEPRGLLINLSGGFLLRGILYCA